MKSNKNYSRETKYEFYKALVAGKELALALEESFKTNVDDICVKNIYTQVTRTIPLWKLKFFMWYYSLTLKLSLKRLLIIRQGRVKRGLELSNKYLFKHPLSSFNSIIRILLPYKGKVCWRYN